MVEIAAGTVIAGRYRLERPLAQGGMGALWTARHLLLDSEVAVKFMETALAASEDARHRFAREAKAAALIQSPHVVQVHDYGVEGQMPFIVMELLRGEDLGKRIKRGGPMSLAAAVEVITQAARALRRAHAAGIVHRDLKPGNIFLARHDDIDVVKLLDFGIAKTIWIDDDESESTRTGQIVGSPHYMSPEQARSSKYVDHRSDLWSLAVIAYRMLTAHLPFPGDELGDVIVKICTEPATPASRHVGLPPGIDPFFERALAKRPEERFQTASELAVAFAVATGQSAAIDPRGSLAGADSGAWSGDVRPEASSSHASQPSQPSQPSRQSLPGGRPSQPPPWPRLAREAASTVPPPPASSPSISIIHELDPSDLATSASISHTPNLTTPRAPLLASPFLPARLGDHQTQPIGTRSFEPRTGSRSDASVAPVTSPVSVTPSPTTHSYPGAGPMADGTDREGLEPAPEADEPSAGSERPSSPEPEAGALLSREVIGRRRLGLWVSLGVIACAVGVIGVAAFRAPRASRPPVAAAAPAPPSVSSSEPAPAAVPPPPAAVREVPVVPVPATPSAAVEKAEVLPALAGTARAAPAASSQSTAARAVAPPRAPPPAAPSSRKNPVLGF